MPALILVLWITLAVMAGSAHAATFGELGEAWGKAGTGAGQFFKPGTFGVDPQTGDVYAGDMNSSGSVYRIQKFTKTGELKAAVEFSRKEEVTGKLIRLVGIAVDPVRERFYVLEACRVGEGSSNCSLAIGNFVAYRLKAFKTTPNAGKLELASTFTLPLGEKELYNPTSIAVDPASGDVVILGEDDGTVVPVPEEEEKTEVVHHTVLERVSSAGVVGTRFVDESNLLRQTGLLAGSAMSLAVGPDGTIYTLTGGKSPGAPGAKSTRAWELPAAMTELKAVPRFAEAAETEEWPLPEENGNGTGFYAGPGIAISPDGSTLYWKETFDGTETVPGGALVRAYSLTEHKTRALYGGGTTRCSIRTSGAGIGATGEGGSEELLAFDYGPEQASPPYGAKVVRFGQGGTGCPASVAKFSIDGQEEDGVVVGKGDTVGFDASASELEDEAFPLELVWTFGDGQKAIVKCGEEEGRECAKPAAMTVSHEYTTAGEFTVKLEIKVLEPVFGNPQPVQHTLIVKAPAAALSVFKTGTGSGTVTSSPAGISCGESCSAEFEAGKVITLTPTPASGSEFTGWSGACSGTGACQVTMSEAQSVAASFALEEGTPPPSEFQLTVFATGTGSGTVASSPAGIACGETCVAKFNTGAAVTLTTTPASGSEFTGWSGACSGTGACQVTMDEARSVSAGFEPEPPPPPTRYTLTVLKAGTGSGTVASSRAGIFCGGKCEKEYEDEENVTLIPTPANGSTFVGWSGGGCAGAGICRVTMDTAKSVTATFDVVIPPAPELAGTFVPLSEGEARPEKKPTPKRSKKCAKRHGKKRAHCGKKAGGEKDKRGKAHHHGGKS
ncbi:MAG TPA: PKD domain-containing protein [Solirubrobacterales bacterium]|nr:PKD domain-containing protein [Solirubrobacterales bacterium]